LLEPDGLDDCFGDRDQRCGRDNACLLGRGSEHERWLVIVCRLGLIERERFVGPWLDVEFDVVGWLEFGRIEHQFRLDKWSSRSPSASMRPKYIDTAARRRMLV
jgi:hypothetical protein